MPRRSTYQSCRAVISAIKQNPAVEKAMILAIQKAYYLHASNPSDDNVLIELAGALELNTEQFTYDLSSEETQNVLMSQIRFSRELGVRGFPSLVLESENGRKLLQLDYNSPDAIVNQLIQENFLQLKQPQ